MRDEINRAKEQAVSIERLRHDFLYTPSTGLLIHRRVKGCAGGKVFAGQPAGYVGKGGYLRVSIDNHPFLAHRVCYAMHHGKWPDGLIDHADRQKANNKIDNLRAATKSTNAINSGLPSNNTSGVKGVHWASRDRKWVVQIMVGGKYHKLGNYDDLFTAAMVRRIAEHKYFGGDFAFPQAA